MLLSRPILLVALITAGLIMTTILLPHLPLADPMANEAQSQATSDAVLTEHIEMGPATLNVTDLSSMQAFYQEVVGLQRLTESEEEVLLGWESRPILRLSSTPSLPPSRPNDAGLYHTAIVFSSRAALAQTVQTLLDEYPTLYNGTSDHIVSEAFYFTDPEGNGLELYFDKDPAGWVWRNGQVQMGSSYIDPEMYIRTFTDEGGSRERKLGHMHLRVGEIAQAKDFYVGILGMSITAEMPSALFVSDGKYHHHIGMNTWESQGAGRKVETRGLRSFEIWLNARSDLDRLQERLLQSKTVFELEGNTITVWDPWGNKIHLKPTP